MSNLEKPLMGLGEVVQQEEILMCILWGKDHNNKSNKFPIIIVCGHRRTFAEGSQLFLI